MSNDIMTNTNGEIVLYQPDKDTRLEVQIHDENVWLSIDQMSKLFGRDKSVIGKHIRTIFKEGELVKHSVWAKFAYSESSPQLIPNIFHVRVLGSSPKRVTTESQ